MRIDNAKSIFFWCKVVSLYSSDHENRPAMFQLEFMRTVELIFSQKVKNGEEVRPKMDLPPIIWATSLDVSVSSFICFLLSEVSYIACSVGARMSPPKPIMSPSRVRRSQTSCIQLASHPIIR